MKCIFCLQTGDIFHTIEHIVPESLGNKEDFLEDGVCDQCQNYFGREIENYVLSKTPFGFWRTLAGTLTKKGKAPEFNPTQKPSKGGKLPDYHPLSDSGITIYPSDEESIIQAEFTDLNRKNEIEKNGKDVMKIVLTPKAIVYIGRFLGKITWNIGTNPLEIMYCVQILMNFAIMLGMELPKECGLFYMATWKKIC